MSNVSYNFAPLNGYASWINDAGRTAVNNPSSDRSKWDRCMALFLLQDTLVRADSEFGDFYKVGEEHQRTIWRLEGEYGRDYKSHPEAKKQSDQSFERVRQQEEEQLNIVRPLWAAIRALVECPAPDISAALFKVELIEREEAWTDGELSRDAFEIVIEDIARLQGEL